MKLLQVFLNPQTQRFRSGWRAFIFVALALLPRLATAFITVATPPASTSSVFEIDGMMIVVYLAMIIWVALVSWFCLHFLEGMRLGSLGYAWHSGWIRDLSLGIGLSAAMIVLVVLIQLIASETQLHLNPRWWQSDASAGNAWRSLIAGLGLATVVLFVAASFEEIVFRGYVFQTLLRDVPVIVPLLLMSLLFGLAHWSNPSRTLFSTTNTVLAGIWLALAYLKTRSLWFPTGLHFGWNWMMGSFFGMPISGLQLRESVFVTTSGEPLWLTGGSYGCEGGLSATLLFALSIALIWRARWVRISPEMAQATTRQPQAQATPLQLNLQ
jgi:membrane protease YdiL (CAAX protease family)